MSNNFNSNSYERFGRLLFDLRVKAGIAKQSELARRLGVRQQTVSRWERGVSRPRDKELQRIAFVLGADQALLLEAAGFAPLGLAATFDRPFPINALSAESFERFCHYFLEHLYRDGGGRVHRAGSSGHKQDGVDISVIGSFGTHSFQCKRVEEFGPRKVLAAIA
jgi:transcriptional regulator with XRE-family HTH domain